jgi:type II secretory pathway pseudopilin PulG
MKPTRGSEHAPHNRHAAFSLVELLTVIGIILLIAGVGAPITSGVLRGSQFSSGVARMSGLLDQARQHAIAHNTYVWVAMADVPPQDGNGEAGLRVAVVESTDGTNAAGWTGTADLGDERFRLVNRLDFLAGTQIGDASTFSLLPADLRPGRQGEEPASQLSFRIPGLGGRAATVFTHVVAFSPRGEATVGPSPVAFADIALRHAQGTASPNVAVIQLTGLTGTLRVYR